MDLGLKDRSFLITGGSAGLGRAAAETLLGEGARVMICGRDEGRLQAAVDALRTSGEATGVRADVSSPADIERLAEAAAEWGPVDGVINNAGSRAGGPFADVDDEVWVRDLELKLLAATRLTRALLPQLVGQGGCVLNVLNVYAKAPAPETMPTAVSRAAGLAFTKGLATEMGPRGLRSNAIVVGYAESDQWRAAAAETGKPVEALHAEIVESEGIPLGRVGEAREFGDLAAFLLSARAAYITGAAVNFDGGLCPVT